MKFRFSKPVHVAYLGHPDFRRRAVQDWIPYCIFMIVILIVILVIPSQNICNSVLFSYQIWFFFLLPNLIFRFLIPLSLVSGHFLCFMYNFPFCLHWNWMKKDKKREAMYLIIPGSSYHLFWISPLLRLNGRGRAGGRKIL